MSQLVTIRKTCRLCGSARIVRSIPLADVPIVSPNVGTEQDEEGRRLTMISAPLDNYLCLDCGLVQLVHVVDPALIYRNYLYRTSVSVGLADHFRGLSEAAVARLGLRSPDLVVEFGSNDGTLLGFFKEAGLRVQGVDPAKQIAAEATARGIPTRADFFNPAVADAIRSEQGPARALLANNAMANIDDLGEIFAGVKTLMAPDGAFVFETQYALDVFEKTLLDVIYHEHISTFSVQPVARSMARYGLALFDAERIPVKGGSLRLWVQHSDGPRPISPRVDALIALEQETGLYDLAYHSRFSEKIAGIKVRMHEQVDAIRARGGTVGAYGTSVGCAALIHQFELEQRLDFLFDDTPFKSRLDGPGYDLPVFTAEGVMAHKPAAILILAWRYADLIIRKHEDYLAQGGTFIIPLPDMKFVSKP
ncbi:MAG: class I SAM-dependent methyltransferase [Pseudolabrys sp.]|nr:class I SAM-dependent methyltransferase [Pseudolabrys sp.]MDP2295754.1 class I SAM-dependent methyltransferase [Pseudolabrys sp.]